MLNYTWSSRVNIQRKIYTKLKFFHRQLTRYFKIEWHPAIFTRNCRFFHRHQSTQLSEHRPDNVSQNSEISSFCLRYRFASIFRVLCKSMNATSSTNTHSTSPRPDIDFGPATIQFARAYIASNTSDSFMNYWYGYRGVETPLPFTAAETKRKKKSRKINDCRPA